jgi:hypothetical protein
MSNTPTPTPQDSNTIGMQAMCAVPLTTLAISAVWYAFGYNDNRPEGAPYVPAEEFARYFVALDALGNRPSIQDAFVAFRSEVTA